LGWEVDEEVDGGWLEEDIEGFEDDAAEEEVDGNQSSSHDINYTTQTQR
jgi:hypothetical protein